jgi:methylase of polypeptide subunit release factors
MIRNPAVPQLHTDELAAFAASLGLGLWEAAYAPYDASVYNFVLARLRPDDVVLDIGAGDFRLALAAAGRVRKVYALEVHPSLVADFLNRMQGDLPPNLHSHKRKFIKTF